MISVKPERASQPLTYEHLQLLLSEVAERLGILRRLKALSWETEQRLRYVRNIISTEEEMRNDWCDACAFLALLIIEGERMDITQIDPKSYALLEQVWLTDVKRLKAYYIWENEQTDDRARNYSKASNDIRQLLLYHPRASMHDFEPLRRYLMENYLRKGDRETLDGNKPGTEALVRKKAHRIWEARRDNDHKADWSRATFYSTMFYENIIEAVTRDDEASTLAVLKALQFSKSSDNRYWIINAFEAATAINFLNKDIIQSLLGKPQLYTFNMEPVDDWPQDITMLSSLRFDKDQKQLIYEGVMSHSDREELLRVLSKEEHD